MFWIGLALGTFGGGIIGVFTMCLVQINRLHGEEE